MDRTLGEEESFRSGPDIGEEESFRSGPDIGEQASEENNKKKGVIYLASQHTL